MVGRANYNSSSSSKHASYCLVLGSVDVCLHPDPAFVRLLLQEVQRVVDPSRLPAAGGAQGNHKVQKVVK